MAFSWVAGKVRLRIFAAGACTPEDIDRAIVAGREATAVDDDPSEFLRMVAGHPALGRLSGVDVRIPRTPTLFESLTSAIFEQLVTGFEARASARRLWAIAGERVPGTKMIAAPRPAAVWRVPMWQMHAIGIGARRAVTLHTCAKRGDAIERLRALPPADVIEKLQSLSGIGPWTANAVARDALGWSDAVPVGDFHAPFVVTAALGGPDDLAREDAAEADRWMLQLLEPFRPHRARVALFLERQATRGWRLPKIDPHRREPWRY